MFILLAEDNADNRDMLSRRLLKRGHRIAVAEDGVIAVAQTRALKPDLVLMDISMPNMSGLEATVILKADPETASVPIIALTAHAMSSDRQACMDAGCNGFASKPIDFPALMDQIETYQPISNAA